MRSVKNQLVVLSSWQSFGLVVLAYFLLGLAAPQACAQPLGLQQLRDLFERRKARIRSLRVEYTADASLLAKPELVKRYIGVGYLLRGEKHEFAFKDGKFYLRITRPASAPALAPDIEPDYGAIPGWEGKQPVTRIHRRDPPPRVIHAPPEYLATYDGSVIRQSAFRVFSIYRPDQASKDQVLFDSPYAVAAALSLPARVDQPANAGPGPLPEALVGRSYTLLSERKRIDGHECVGLQAPGADRMWLDPNCGYAPRLREVYDSRSGTLLARYLCEDLRAVEADVWLPFACLVDVAGGANAPVNVRGIPLLRYAYSVTRLSINDVGDELFAPKPPKGLTVADKAMLNATKERDTTVVYQQPASEDKLEEAVAEGVRHAKLRAPATSNRWLVLGVASALSLIAGSVAVAIWKRKRERAGRA